MRKITFIFLIIISLSSCSKSIYKFASKHAPYDVIIVPGVPFYGDEWEDVMKMRVYWSYLLYERGITKNIIYSGAAVYTPYYESKIMKLYAVKLGIPENVIYTDTIAEHSTENLWYSYKLAENHGFKKIALATDPVQNIAVRRFRRYHELNVRTIPIIFSEVHKYMGLPSPKINPASAYVKKFNPT